MKFGRALSRKVKAVVNAWHMLVDGLCQIFPQLNSNGKEEQGPFSSGAFRDGSHDS